MLYAYTFYPPLKPRASFPRSSSAGITKTNCAQHFLEAILGSAPTRNVLHQPRLGSGIKIQMSTMAVVICRSRLLGTSLARRISATARSSTATETSSRLLWRSTSTSSGTSTLPESSSLTPSSPSPPQTPSQPSPRKDKLVREKLEDLTVDCPNEILGFDIIPEVRNFTLPSISPSLSFQFSSIDIELRAHQPAVLKSYTW